ncbi:MAG: glycosyltransferase, partial [Prevotella sp.]|nr:glycosyltransferase [Prevotella sp.]
MRVLIVNTSERTGGAAVAANRLMMALNNNGVKAKMLVRDKESDSLTVVGLPKSPMLNWHFLWERLVIFFHCRFSRKHLFEIDLANSGSDITKLREFQEADVIHLHWINQGMLSLSGIRKILKSGKPVVWTMHDIWPATAICHLTLNCRNFTTHCHNCRLLPGKGSSSDLSTSVWRK